tara:strand:+ start:1104 stop:2237 length:1134 start_codon:yes stop_codon:yes gene_type:complete
MSNQIVEMNFKQIATYQAMNQQLDIPMAQIVLGPPGTAKTAWFKNTFPSIIAKARGIDELEIAVIVSRPAIRDAIEFAGVAIPQKDQDGNLVTRFSLPNLLEQINIALKTHKAVLVILDELSAADDDIQKALADSLDAETRTLAEHPLPANVIIVATGNRSKDKAGSRRLLSHVIGRVAITELISETSIWVDYSRKRGTNELVVSTAECHPDFFEDVPVDGSTHNTWRQATNAGNLIDIHSANEPAWDGLVSSDLEMFMAQMIGKRAAAMVASHARDIAYELPTPEQVYANPETCRVPDQTGHQLLTVNRAIANLGAQNDSEAANQLFTFILRCRPDLQITLAVKICKATTDAGLILSHHEANNFIRDNSDLLGLTN